MKKNVLSFLPSVIFLLLIFASYGAKRSFHDLSNPESKTQSATQSLLVGETFYNWKKSQWVIHAQATITYDSLLRIEKILLESGLDEQKMVMTQVSHHYDAGGRIDEYKVQEWSDSIDIWLLTASATSEYDEVGHLMKITYKNWKGGVQGTGYIHHFEYDDIGRKKNILGEIWKNGQWKNDYRSSFIYEKGTSNEKTLDERWIEERWVPYHETVVTFDNNKGERTSTTRALRKDAGGGSIMRYVMSVDSLARREEEITQTWSTGKWVDNVKDIRIKDSVGNVIELIRQSRSTPATPWTNWNRGVMVYKNFRHNIPPILMSPPEIPSHVKLYDNFPNPFNLSTHIRFIVPRTTRVDLRVYDILGKEIETLVSEPNGAGEYTVTWEARDIASGVYFLRMVADDFTVVHKMNLVK